MDHKTIIKLWPSVKILSEELGEPYETVRKWRYRSIPSKHWIALVELAKKRKIRGVTLEALADQRANPRAPVKEEHQPPVIG